MTTLFREVFQPVVLRKRNTTGSKFFSLKYAAYFAFPPSAMPRSQNGLVDEYMF